MTLTFLRSNWVGCFIDLVSIWVCLFSPGFGEVIKGCLFYCHYIPLQRQDGVPSPVPSVSFTNFSKTSEAPLPHPSFLRAAGRSVLGCPFCRVSWRQVSVTWLHPEGDVQDNIGKPLDPVRLQHLLAYDLIVRPLAPHTLLCPQPLPAL